MSVQVEHSQRYEHVQYIWPHQPHIANVLEQITFTVNYLCDELVHPADDDVDEADGDDGAEFWRWEFIVAVAEVEDNGGDDQLSDGEHEVMCEVGEQFFIVVDEERPETTSTVGGVKLCAQCKALCCSNQRNA